MHEYNTMTVSVKCNKFRCMYESKMYVQFMMKRVPRVLSRVCMHMNMYVYILFFINEDVCIHVCII